MGDNKTDKRIIGLVIFVVITCVLGAGAAIYMMLPTQTLEKPTGELDFSVSGTSDCLRFLNSSVPTIYVPFTIATNENWKLTISATKMPGGANGWTDIYIYKGYWDEGTNHICKAEDLYPIINEIKSADTEIRANVPYTETFGGSTLQSYTVFFVVPPGGQATFHVTLKPA